MHGRLKLPYSHLCAIIDRLRGVLNTLRLCAVALAEICSSFMILQVLLSVDSVRAPSFTIFFILSAKLYDNNSFRAFPYAYTRAPSLLDSKAVGVGLPIVKVGILLNQ